MPDFQQKMTTHAKRQGRKQNTILRYKASNRTRLRYDRYLRTVRPVKNNYALYPKALTEKVDNMEEQIQCKLWGESLKESKGNARNIATVTQLKTTSFLFGQVYLFAWILTNRM